MKAWPVHASFTALFVGTLAVRAVVPDVFNQSVSLAQSVLQVARSQGLSFQREEIIADTGRRALTFDAPGCTQPVRVIVRSLTFEEEPFTLLASERGYTHRYIYIDHVWNRPHRLAVWIQRIKYAVLAIFGQTQYVPAPYLLQVEVPSLCPIAGAIDWREAWRRDYVANANSAAE